MSTDLASFPGLSDARPVTAPAWPAFASTGATVAAVITVIFWRDDPTLTVLGYALGALVAPAFVVAYRFGRRRARQDPFFVPNRVTERWIVAVLGLAMAAGMANAWFVATELAKK